MIQKLNQICEKVNKLLGISVTLPNPGKKSLRIGMVCNFIIGVTLIAIGIISPKKWCAIVGGIGIVSSIVLQREIKRKVNDK